MAQLDDLIVKLILDKTGFSTGVADAKAQAQSLSTDAGGALKTLGLGGAASFLTLAGAITGLTAFLKDSYKTTMEYGDAVRQLSKLNGTSVEETSKLIQVADDHKIAVSDLNLASKTLSKEGIPMTIDSLAGLSDAYLALQDPAERQAFLLQNFGARGGVVFVELMEQGAKAIKDQAAATEAGLIPTQEQIDKQRELQSANDKLDDSWKAMKMTIGNAMVPGLLSLSETLNALLGINQNVNAETLSTLGLWDRLIAILAMNPIKQFGLIIQQIKGLFSGGLTSQTTPNSLTPQYGSGNPLDKNERDYASPNSTTNIIINNPTGETSEASVNRALQTQSYLGNRR